MIIIVAVVIVAIIVIDGVYDDSSRSRGRDNYSNAEIPAGYSHNRSCDNCRGQGGRAQVSRIVTIVSKMLNNRLYYIRGL